MKMIKLGKVFKSDNLDEICGNLYVNSKLYYDIASIMTERLNMNFSYCKNEFLYEIKINNLEIEIIVYFSLYYKARFKYIAENKLSYQIRFRTSLID